MKFFKDLLFKILNPIINFFYSFWLLSEKNLKKNKNFIYLENYNKVQNLKHNSYFIYNSNQRFLFEDFNNIKVSKHFKCYIENCYALSSGDYPVFVDKYLRVFKDSINLNINYLLSSGIITKILQLIFSSNKKVLNKVICYSGSLGDNKFHFLIDYLPRLQYLIENNIENNYKFIIHQNVKFQIYYLKLLGIKEENLYQWDQNITLIDSLLIYSLRYVKYKKKYEIYNQSSIIWLKNFFDNKFKSLNKLNKFKKIFVLRKKNDSRYLINEKEVRRYLNKFQYNFIYLEDFKESEIVQIFKSAQIIITVHGASLSNIIFSNNLKIIEIYPFDRPEEDAFVYFQLSKTFNFEHHLFISKDVNNKGLTLDTNLFEKQLSDVL